MQASGNKAHWWESMLRYKADIRTLAFVLFYFLFTTISWWFFDQMNGWTIGVIVGGLCISSFLCAVVVHNAIHVPIFKSRKMNAIFQIILTLTYGHSVSVFVAGHNLSHHKNLASLKDIARTSKMKFRWNFLNQLLFFFWTIPSVLRTESSWSKKMLKEHPKWFSQYLLELAILYGVKIGLLFANFEAALLLIFLPHFYAQWGIVGTNYWQHDGCDMSHPYNHSRNFTSPLLNFFFLNNGFHGLHHNDPTLHWSLLPEVYKKEYRPHLHPNLDRHSLASYVWESCIYPGIRKDFMGAEVVLPDGLENKDESWVSSTDLGGHKQDLGAIG